MLKNRIQLQLYNLGASAKKIYERLFWAQQTKTHIKPMKQVYSSHMLLATPPEDIISRQFKYTSESDEQSYYFDEEYLDTDLLKMHKISTSKITMIHHRHTKYGYKIY